MAKIKSLAMAASVASLSSIEIKNTFFGLSESVVYTPTDSAVNVVVQEYTSEQGSRMKHLLELAPARLSEALSADGKPVPTAVGPFHLEACVSRDRRFAAVQLFRYAGIDFEPVTDFRCCEGDDAAALAALI